MPKDLYARLWAQLPDDMRVEKFTLGTKGGLVAPPPGEKPEAQVNDKETGDGNGAKAPVDGQ